ncbi:MAG: tetratricopeptide repeat protein [Syntrophus sp. (in: bacteria)]
MVPLGQTVDWKKMKKKRKEKKELAPPRPPNLRTRFPGVYFSVFFLIAAGILAYGNSLHGPFIYDDIPNIVDNQVIHNIRNAMNLSLGPAGQGLNTRPVIRFSLAVNYAIGGDHVRGYHILNLAFHLLAGITLFGIVRRTLLTERMKGIYGPAATLLGFACALIWLLHPIQTQAVTYIIQRCESMMGLLFLLTFYCAIRGWQSSRSGPWHGAAVLFFFLGVGSKEVIVVAPPLLLIYDAIFMKKGWKAAVSTSWPLYSGLAGGLIVLGFLVILGMQVAQGAGFKESLPLVPYWRTQSGVILHYLRLVVWPDALCLDYAWPLMTWQQAWASIIIVSVLMALTGWAVLGRKPVGFPGVWFFAILAPTSLVALPDPAFEHRMYLPLAALVVLAVVGVYRLGVILQERYAIGKDKTAIAGVVGVLVLALLLGGITYKRNGVYADEVSIWTDTVQKAPRNSRAHLNLGVVLDQAGNPYEAIRHFEEAIRIEPDYAGAYSNMGNVLTNLGKTDEGIRYLQEAIRLKPDYAEPYSNLGVAFGRSGRLKEAVVQLEHALRLKPDYAAAHSNLGLALGRLGRKQEAIDHFQEALRLKPDYQAARGNLELLMRMNK